MVGIRIFFIFILSFLLFSAPSYALRPRSTGEISAFTEEETASNENEEQREEIEREKKKLMEKVSPLREERSKNLHPFVYEIEGAGSEILEEFYLDVKTTPSRHAAKGFIPTTPDKESLKVRPSSHGLVSKLIPNLVFFSAIIIAFLAIHFFIRPKSK